MAYTDQDFLGSVAQENISLVTEILRTAVLGENIYTASFYIPWNIFFKDAELDKHPFTAIANAPVGTLGKSQAQAIYGSDDWRSWIYNSQDTAIPTGKSALLGYWLEDYFAGAHSQAAILIRLPELFVDPATATTSEYAVLQATYDITVDWGYWKVFLTGYQYAGDTTNDTEANRQTYYWVFGTLIRLFATLCKGNSVAGSGTQPTLSGECPYPITALDDIFPLNAGTSTTSVHSVDLNRDFVWRYLHYIFPTVASDPGQGWTSPSDPGDEVPDPNDSSKYIYNVSQGEQIAPSAIPDCILTARYATQNPGLSSTPDWMTGQVHNDSLLRLGNALASYNKSGTVVGATMTFIQKTDIVLPNNKETPLLKSYRDILINNHISVSKPVGLNTGICVHEGEPSLNGNYPSPNWIVAYVEYMSRVQIADFITKSRVRRSAWSYRVMLDCVQFLLELFGPGGADIIDDIAITAPSFSDLPTESNQQITIPNAWSATYMVGLTKVVIYGTLTITT